MIIKIGPDKNQNKTPKQVYVQKLPHLHMVCMLKYFSALSINSYHTSRDLLHYI